mmetsp:Transcript_31887/g.51594  ORF Transcript_31887/g.51594 Transcript_31887/m.51594 type:complete len:83 (+) Transcript_31887:34-282(+)|eukprot:CAMPEP_0202686378 /NCGR_PEP_ID=MMETSP1385-20130828/2189_1 /ASSEMBLY_ACC=CAM_ASM_000861 /TAXON_ID=933848 /ORGANISM="Elphidium margaritaceum" /LENGTH=82 /DNA_ID=CAMNT_0049340943 /DNA_START=28 /DNA_END=276 /DNA_ORIENTATION=+
MSSSSRGYKDGIWISHFHRQHPLVDMIDKEWRRDKLFCDDIWIKPEMEKKANQAIDNMNPKQKAHKLWQATGLQRLNGEQMS